MTHYIAGLERNFYRRILGASILFLFLGILLGFAGGYSYRVALDDKEEHENIRQELKEQRGRIMGLEGALGVNKRKEKPKAIEKGK